MRKAVSISILLVVFFIHYSWCQSNQENSTNVKWFKSGSHPSEYTMDGDLYSTNVDKAGYMKCIVDNPSGFGSLTTSFKPDTYLGKRIKLSVNLKTTDIDKGAMMWMRVDGEDAEILSFDNMGNRAIIGSNDWKIYDIVLDVPKNSSAVLYGMMLIGKGEFWAKDLQLQIVDESEPSTNIALTDMAVGLRYLYKGNYQKALPFLEQLIRGKGEEDHIRYYSLYYYIALLETDQKMRSKEFIRDFSNKQGKNDWVSKIALFLKGNITENELLKASFNENNEINNGQLCEGYFYIGMTHKFKGNPEKAKSCFEKCVETDLKDFVEYNLAQVELNRIAL